MKRRLFRIAAGCVGAVTVLCLGCLAFGAWYSSTPEYKTGATGTALSRVTQTANALSRAAEVAMPTEAPQATSTEVSTPTQTPTDTPVPTTSPTWTVTLTQTSRPTVIPTLPPTFTRIPPTWTAISTARPVPTRTAMPTARPLPTWTPVIVNVPTVPAGGGGGGGGRVCCKVCTTGKACGNSCIARNKTCHQPPGCACDG